MDRLEIAVSIIAAEEGYMAKPYFCSLGYPTIGIGLKIGSHNQPLEHFEGLPSMPRDVAELWCRLYARDVEDSFNSYPLILAAADNCNEVQRAVLISMAYQLGTRGLSRFERMLGCCIKKDFEGAGAEMLDSLLEEQTPNRTGRQASMLHSGKLLPYYKG